MFDHLMIDEKLKEMGWRRKEINWFKEGMADAILGEWKDNYMTYDYVRQAKLKPNARERAYCHGQRAGEEYIKRWVQDMSEIGALLDD